MPLAEDYRRQRVEDHGKQESPEGLQARTCGHPRGSSRPHEVAEIRNLISPAIVQRKERHDPKQKIGQHVQGNHAPGEYPKPRHRNGLKIPVSIPAFPVRSRFHQSASSPPRPCFVRLDDEYGQHNQAVY